MNFIDTFERKGLFIFTRIAAIALIVSLIIAGTIGIILFFNTYINYSSHIDPNEIINRIKIDENKKNKNIKPEIANPAIVEPDLLPGIKIPFVLQRYFSDQNNRNVLLNQLKNIPEDYRQEYLNNMAEVALLADKEQIDVVKTINLYMEMKKKLYINIDNKKAQDISMRYKYLGAIAMILVIIALFSLVLVLLAIERNTRIREQ